MEEQERQERNRSRQTPKERGEDSANLDFMLALSLQNEGQAPTLAEQDFWRVIYEADQSREGPSAPGWGRQHHSQRDPPFVPSKRLPDWDSLDRVAAGNPGFP